MNDKILILESKIKMPLMELPVKSTAVKVKDGVALISPVPKLKYFKKKLDEFGKVTDIVAPNCYHNIGIPSASKLYPDARVWGTMGLEKKLPDIRWHKMIGKENWIHQDELLAIPIEGMPSINEILFYHKPTKVLIVTDFCFNHIYGKGFGYWFFFHLFGTYKKFALSRFFLRSVKDRKKFLKSIDEILNLEIESIIIPHGENLHGNVRAKLIDALKEKKVLPKNY